ncbi:uncharacterized protein LOC104585203 [Brachypodium distachyon]|uniref:uncharacterized protein LOC104585203 n=1 Tax=Brachypodium distachyon TaxID=15368 RepID=UPI0005300AE8|nr:uncharacterized protein LOC104585203 [Brachypodium distachyon]|eukprot:XP_010239531.1 uncharacterized protein LOC104585203 [Brachypodium distachyon]
MGWVMEEYHCLLPEAVVADGEMVLCKIHLSPTACDEARQESAAYLAGTQEQEDQPAPMAVTAKRPAPAASDDPPCAPKRARVAVAEADHSQDMDGFRSPLEDLLADEPAVEAADDNTDEDQEEEAAALPAGETEQQIVDFDFDLPVLDEDALSEVILSLDEDLPIASDEDFDFKFPTAEELNAMLSNVGDWPLSFAPDGDLLRFPGLPAAVL